ncbi:MAG: beta-lactamase-like protein, partial [Thermomicrobiales bacterium]|nr:beta-lactamase-like protein [Thermomicrobiales bacterium]
ELGLDPADLDYVLISHADVDHFGGNAALRAAAPRAIFCAHVADCDWIGDRERILRERYGWYAAHGSDADYDADTKDWLRNAMGPAVSRSAIITDATLGAGLLNNEGEVIHPPPYMLLEEYEATVRRLQRLAPERLLTAHYAVMEGTQVDRFLDESLAFVARTRSAIEAAIEKSDEVTIAGLLTALNPILGPFTSMANELGGPIRAHLQELVARGRIEEIADRRPPAWRVSKR